jgi:hypothetical protein
METGVTSASSVHQPAAALRPKEQPYYRPCACVRFCSFVCVGSLCDRSLESSWIKWLPSVMVVKVDVGEAVNRWSNRVELSESDLRQSAWLSNRSEVRAVTKATTYTDPLSVFEYLLLRVTKKPWCSGSSTESSGINSLPSHTETVRGWYPQKTKPFRYRSVWILLAELCPCTTWTKRRLQKEPAEG